MRWLAVLSLAVVCFALTSGAQQPPPKKDTPAAAFDFVGRIEAQSVDIRPRVTGVLDKVLVKDGAAVKQGDVLAEIDPRQYQADVEVAKAKLAVADATAKATAATLARTKSAFGRGILTRDDLTQSEAEVGRSDAMARAAKAELDLAELNLSWTRIHAPMGGRIGRFSRAPGSLITADGPPLVTVVAAEPLSVGFDVDERTMLKFRRDGAAEPGRLTAVAGLPDEDGFPHTVTIDFIDPQFNPSTGTVRVRGAIANPNGLMSPGMAVRVRLAAAGK
jgi:RND family efflux transporter MFP subunit